MLNLSVDNTSIVLASEYQSPCDELDILTKNNKYALHRWIKHVFVLITYNTFESDLGIFATKLFCVSESSASYVISFRDHIGGDHIKQTIICNNMGYYGYKSPQCMDLPSVVI